MYNPGFAGHSPTPGIPLHPASRHNILIQIPVHVYSHEPAPELIMLMFETIPIVTNIRADFINRLRNA